MGTHMKTTVELSEPLFQSAKQLAQQSQTTLRALIEEGLRRVIADSPAPSRVAFKLQNASVQGRAMRLPDPRDWQALETAHLTQHLTQHLEVQTPPENRPENRPDKRSANRSANRSDKRP